MCFKRSYLQPQMIAIRKKWKGSEVVDWRGRVSCLLGLGGGDRRQEEDVRVDDDKPNNETGEFLIL